MCDDATPSGSGSFWECDPGATRFALCPRLFSLTPSASDSRTTTAEPRHYSLPDSFLIHLPEAIQNQISITRRLDRYRMRLLRLLKIKRAAGDFDDLPKRFMGGEVAAFSTDDLAVVKKHASRLRTICQHQCTRQSRIFDRLDGIEHADDGKVAGEAYAGLHALRCSFL